MKGGLSYPPAAFARNRMCVYARPGLGLTADNLVERLLTNEIKIRASTPGADPSGDYAVMIFDRIDRQHPGAGKLLRDRAQALRDALKNEPPGAIAAEFRNRQVDVMIAYCSASAALERQVLGLTAIPVSPALDPRAGLWTGGPLGPAGRTEACAFPADRARPDAIARRRTHPAPHSGPVTARLPLCADYIKLLGTY